MLITISMTFIRQIVFILLIINTLLLIYLLYSFFINKLIKRKYNKAYTHLQPYVMEFLNDDTELNKLQPLIKNDYKKNIAIDIMLQYSKDYGINLCVKFKKAELHKYLISKLQRRPKLNLIKKLSEVKCIEAYESLRLGTTSANFEIKYMSYLALSTLPLNVDQFKEVFETLISSDIPRDRIIEMLINLNNGFEINFQLLETQKTEISKVVLLRALSECDDIFLESNSDRLVKYLYHSTEIRISIVTTLCRTKNIKYLPPLTDLYNTESQWEVRAIIAKSLRSFSSPDTIQALKSMANDQVWWVKYNASESLIFMGSEGIMALINLSLNKKDQKTSDLAYYFLNAHSATYNTVKKIEV